MNVRDENEKEEEGEKSGSERDAAGFPSQTHMTCVRLSTDILRLFCTQRAIKIGPADPRSRRGCVVGRVCGVGWGVVLL